MWHSSKCHSTISVVQNSWYWPTIFPEWLSPEKNKIMKVTWRFGTVKYQYPSCTTNGSVVVIMIWCHASAKSGMMLQQWWWRGDAVKDVCTHVNVMSFTPTEKIVFPCTEVHKTHSQSDYYRHCCSKFL
jgi:hypothetical protein